MELSRMTWTDVRDVETDVVLLPVGSTEQHGPHAPLGTDTMLAEVVASAGAEATDREAIVAPTIPISIAEEHRAFAGTLWVSPDTFRAYLSESIASIAHHHQGPVIVVNGHGGNRAAIEETCARVRRDNVAFSIPFTWFSGIDLSPEVMGHGGPVETAALLSAYPDVVRKDRLEDAAATGADRWGEWVRGVNFCIDSDEFSEGGTVGDPRTATKQRGEKLLSDATEALVDVIDEAVTRAYSA